MDILENPSACMAFVFTTFQPNLIVDSRTQPSLHQNFHKKISTQNVI